MDNVSKGPSAKKEMRLPRRGKSTPDPGAWRIVLNNLDRKYSIIRVAKFGVATGAGFLVIEAILILGMILFYHTMQVPSIAFSSPIILGLTALAFGVGATASFVVNERVTFRDKTKSRRKAKTQAHWLARWSKFQLACLFGNVTIIVLQLVLLATISLSPAFGHILGSLVTYPVTYVISSHFVWEIRPFQ